MNAGGRPVVWTNFMPTPHVSNFAHLTELEPALAKQGELAELLLLLDASTCVVKLRQFAELLAKRLAVRSGTWKPDESQRDRLDRLRRENLLTDEVFQVFRTLRQEGNKATHDLEGEETRARFLLRLAWQLGWWFHHTVAPQAITQDNALVYVEPTHKPTPATVEGVKKEEAQAERDAEQVLKDSPEEGSVRVPIVRAAQAASQLITLSEADTRRLIDQALRDAGWEADSETLKYSQGSRPGKGKNRAIAEWPTASGSADYVLFIGLTPVGVIEAKRKNINAYSHLDQAQRYSKHIIHLEDCTLPGGPWGEYQIPFLYSTNARPYLKQHEHLSGTWFLDARHPTNHPRPLMGWPSPEGLTHLLNNDPVAQQAVLDELPVSFSFPLRPYQKEAIKAVEQAMGEQQRSILVAMATGTGKTKTCIALIYRLLKSKRARRILFLVDRRSLGEQAAGAFNDTRMEGGQTFSSIYNLAELDGLTFDPDVVVQVATVQSLVGRLFSSSDTLPPLPTDLYDCIVVDEAHRGYLLDRNMSSDELTFRDSDDYLSKYRRVLEYFDATRIGLTATPALQTVEIFAKPVYTYSYQQAVVDGFLIDHAPPTLIKTKLSQDGIHFAKGDEIKVLDTATGVMNVVNAPDELHFDVDAFHRKVISESFNTEVCRFLAKTLPLDTGEKTLIFCVNDLHADLVVKLLKQQLKAAWGSVDNDVVAKITGTVDDPLGMIRRYKNEKMPVIAVTVDLLTTGIDVPEISNLVFLRRIRSRILYDQMLGRATRPCDKLQKTEFRVFDAVGIYRALQGITDMRPVVQKVDISFQQLLNEVRSLTGSAQEEALRQLRAKLQNRRRTMSDTAKQDFQTASGGQSIDQFLAMLASAKPAEIAGWLTHNAGLSEVLDQSQPSKGTPIVLSDHQDEFLGTETGYGANLVRPADYLDAFTTYVNTNPDGLAALTTAVTRPAELTRQDLKSLELKLRQLGYTPVTLDKAWKETTNQQGAAQIIGYIRHAALGEELKPFPERVDRALKAMLVGVHLSVQEEAWLTLLAQQTKALGVVDTEVLNDPDLMFRSKFGPLARQDTLLGGKLGDLLLTFNHEVWNA